MQVGSLTSNVISGYSGAQRPTLCPIQVKVVLMKSTRAMNAMRLAQMFATRVTAIEAPAAAASIVLWYGLQ